MIHQQRTNLKQFTLYFILVNIYSHKINGFFMGTKHTTPPTQFHMENDNGKKYAKVDGKYVEYNDSEMYYDKNDKEKSQREIDEEDKKALMSDSKTRKEDAHNANQAWKQAQREEVSDVTGMPMYEGEQYGEMDYGPGATPKVFGNQPLGEPNMVPHYEAGPGQYPQYGNLQYGGPPQFGGPIDFKKDPRFGGPQMGNFHKYHANPLGMNPLGGFQVAEDDLMNNIRNKDKKILTLNPVSTEEKQTLPPHTTTGIAGLTVHQEGEEEAVEGMMPGISQKDFEKYHGEHGDQKLQDYAKKRRVVELNEKRASYAIAMASARERPEFDMWLKNNTEPQKTTTTKRTKPTTEFVPRADVEIPDFRLNLNFDE